MGPLVSLDLAKSQLLRRSELGHLKSEDYAFVFGQYYLFERGRLRCVSALMAQCRDDAQRRRLHAAVHEEETERTARLQRLEAFIAGALGVRADYVELRDVTEIAIERFVSHALTAHPTDTLALLHITRQVLDQVYALFAKGMEHLNCAASAIAELRALPPAAFDSIVTELLESSRTDDAMTSRALDLHARFMDSLYRDLELWRLSEMLDYIKAGKSLAFKKPNPRLLTFNPSHPSRQIYASNIPRLNVEFSVQRVHFNCQVLDPRIVRIPPGKFNEKHKHAHETLFYIYAGTGEVQIDEAVVPVEAGKLVFVPRWALHQSRNLGSEEMVILAVTDFGLTGDAYIGKYHSTARLQPTGDKDFQFVRGGGADAVDSRAEAGAAQ